MSDQDYTEWMQDEFEKAEGTVDQRAFAAFGIVCSGIEVSGHDGEIASEYRKAHEAKTKLFQRIYQTV